MKRRVFLTAGTAALACSHIVQSFAQEQPANHSTAADDVKRWGFVGPEDDPEFGPAITGDPTAGSAVGTGEARNKEVAKAMRLMFDAPVEVFKRSAKGMKISLVSGKKITGQEPRKFDLDYRFDVENPISYAAYFDQLTDKNDDGELYKSEWNGARANPLIVGFFGMTNTLPSDGDQTAWCAAFVNMCLRAAAKEGTLSALSGSFRKHGKDAKELGGPMLGDVVVFRNTGERGNKGFGHVGFFVAEEGDTIWVLGGNQRSSSPNRGEVTLAPFAKVSSSLLFHSYRRVGIMRL